MNKIILLISIFICFGFSPADKRPKAIKMRPHQFTSCEIEKFESLDLSPDWFCTQNCDGQVYKADNMDLYSLYIEHPYIEVKIPVGPGKKIKRKDYLVGFVKDGELRMYNTRKGTSTSYESLGIFP